MTITTNELDEITIGVYKNSMSTKKTDVIKLKDLLLGFQNNNKEQILKLREIKDETQQKNFKKNNLYGVTMSGLLGENRTTNCVLKYNNIMCVDVDEEDNKEIFSKYGIEEIKKRIFNLDFVYCVCLSCRGKGFYFIVPIPDSKYIDVYYTSMFYKLKRHGIVIDKHCKDIARIRFVSYDDNILIKQDCEIEVYDEVSEEQIQEKKLELERVKHLINKKYNYSHDKQLDYLRRTIDYIISKGFDTGEHWSSWATIGKYLKTLGEDGRILFHKLSEVSSGYKGYNDVEKNWRRFTQCQSIDESLGKFYVMVRNKYGDNWRDEMNKLKK